MHPPMRDPQKAARKKMNENSEIVQLNRRRKLDELFAEQQYLSATMKARSIHDRLDDEPIPMVIPIITQEASDGASPTNFKEIPWTHQPSERKQADARSESMSMRTNTVIEPYQSQTISISSSKKENKQEERMLLQLSISSEVKDEIRGHSQHGLPAPDVMTIEEAANYLRVSVAIIRTWVREKSVPCVHLGKKVRFRKESLLSWLGEQEVEFRTKA